MCLNLVLRANPMYQPHGGPPMPGQHNMGFFTPKLHAGIMQTYDWRFVMQPR